MALIQRRFIASLMRALVLCVLVGAAALASPLPPVASSSAPAALEETTALFLPMALHDYQHERTNVFGFQVSEVRFRDPAMIRAVRSTGADWWRTFVFWDEIEPQRTRPPTYDWRFYDKLILTASDLGLEVIAEIQGNPKWVAAYPGGPPDDLDALAQFVAAAVERYDGDGYRDAPGSPRVRYWELYNEPDNADPTLAIDGRGWGFWGHRGDEYARMLQRVYPALKIANPNARVVFGGMAYDAFLPDNGPFDPEFLDDALAAGAGEYFDVMNFHFYPLFAPQWQDHGIGIIGKTEAVRAKLAEHGVEKPIMVTEAGSWSDASPPYPPTTPEEQARYVAKLHARSLVAGLTVAIWFQFDDVAGTDDPARGLLDRHLRRKPAYAAYELTAELLDGVVPDRSARDLSAPGEVYWFRRGMSRIAVAWTNDGAIETLSVQAPAARRTRILGVSHVVRDVADGVIDGVTHVPYGSEPVFVEPLDDR